MLTHVNASATLSLDAMPTSGRHPKKEVADAVAAALAKGWRLQPGGGHVWGTLYCSHAARDGCKVRIHSSPQNPGSHARRIRQEVDACPH